MVTPTPADGTPWCPVVLGDVTRAGMDGGCATPALLGTGGAPGRKRTRDAISGGRADINYIDLYDLLVPLGALA